MKEFTVSMALVDFIPVILFCWGAIIMQKLMYDRMSKSQFALFAAGTVDVIMAGVCKAFYKLLYGAGACDFISLNNVFFPVQSFGFLLAGLGVLFMLANRKDKFMESANSVALPLLPLVFLAAEGVAPQEFSGTFFFVTLMCLGLGCMNIGLSVQAARDGRKKAIPFFIIAFVCSLCMGYLSSKDFDKAIFNWIAQGINCLGQGAFLAAALIYRKK